MSNFKVFFVCPKCNKPLIARDKLVETIKDGSKYCTKCGAFIEKDIWEAAAKAKETPASSGG